MKRFLFLVLTPLLVAACNSPSDTANADHQSGNTEPGRRLFASNCGECHGVDARGTDKGPPLIHKIYVPGHHADIAFVLAVRQGVRTHHWRFGDMPPQPNVSEDQVRDIIAWVRQEQRKAGIR